MPKFIPTPPEIRFWKYVNKTDSCWLWTGAKNEHGYGKLYLGKTDGKRETIKSHRLSWIIHNGSIPDGFWILHKCDVPACVNPSHLFLGTFIDNVRDMVGKRRMAHGETSYAKLSSDQVRAILKDTRKQVDIAKEYGVVKQTISDIKRKRNWKYLDENITPATQPF